MRRQWDLPGCVKCSLHFCICFVLPGVTGIPAVRWAPHLFLSNLHAAFAPREGDEG